MEIADLRGIAGLIDTNRVSINPPQCSEIIIAADNDQVGLNAAKLLAQRLANEGRKVRIAPPPDGTKDWNEAIRGKGANIEQLREHILGAKLVKPEKCILALPIDEFLNLTVPKREYHLRPWLTTGSLCMIHAKRGEAKTSL